MPDKLAKAIFVILDGAPTVAFEQQHLLEGSDGGLVFGRYYFFRFRISFFRFRQSLRDIFGRREIPLYQSGVKMFFEESECQFGVWNIPSLLLRIPAPPVYVTNAEVPIRLEGTATKGLDFQDNG